MTITEYLAKRTRTINTIKWIGVGVAAIAGLVAVFTHQSRLTQYGVILAPMIPAIAIMSALARRLKCPRCQAALNQYLMQARDRVPLRFCPKCGANFSDEMPYNPIG